MIQPTGARVIIPCRSGSQRVPGKNWLVVGAASLVERAIICGLAVKDQWPRSTIEVVVDAETHLEQIAHCACRYRGLNWLTRPAHLNDSAMIELIMWTQVVQPSELDILLLQPTSPFRSPALTVQFWDLWLRHRHERPFAYSVNLHSDAGAFYALHAKEPMFLNTASVTERRRAFAWEVDDTTAIQIDYPEDVMAAEALVKLASWIVDAAS